MNFHFKVDNLQLSIDRPFSARQMPALEINITSYEVKGDAELLVECIKDLTAKIQAAAEEAMYGAQPPGVPAPANDEHVTTN